MTLLLIIVVILLIGGGGWGYNSGALNGRSPVFIILVVVVFCSCWSAASAAPITAGIGD
jgi:hypothetical protein